jgi:hypothetical protein
LIAAAKRPRFKPGKSLKDTLVWSMDCIKTENRDFPNSRFSLLEVKGLINHP